jgi:hypothetical protein
MLYLNPKVLCAKGKDKGMREKGRYRGVFVGLLLSGGLLAVNHGDEGVVRHGSMRAVKAAVRKRQEECFETASLPGQTAQASHLQPAARGLGKRWDRVEDLSQLTSAQRRNSHDFTAEGVDLQVPVSGETSVFEEIPVFVETSVSREATVSEEIPVSREHNFQQNFSLASLTMLQVVLPALLTVEQTPPSREGIQRSRPLTPYPF